MERELPSGHSLVVEPRKGMGHHRKERFLSDVYRTVIGVSAIRYHVRLDLMDIADGCPAACRQRRDKMWLHLTLDPVDQAIGEFDTRKVPPNQELTKENMKSCSGLPTPIRTESAASILASTTISLRPCQSRSSGRCWGGDGRRNRSGRLENTHCRCAYGSRTCGCFVGAPDSRQSFSQSDSGCSRPILPSRCFVQPPERVMYG
jgi:hypothetical protein